MRDWDTGLEDCKHTKNHGRLQANIGLVFDVFARTIILYIAALKGGAINLVIAGVVGIQTGRYLTPF